MDTHSAAETISEPPVAAFDNSYARLPDRFFARTAARPVAAPKLVRINKKLVEAQAAEIPQAFVRPWLFVAAHMGGSWLAGVGALLLGKSNGWDVWTVLLSVLVASFGGAKILEMWAERWFANLPLPGEVKP